ncbi:tetratricopeptide repeat protein [Streptomyces sp. NBC_01485]|uniref:tetratricopeptide repeat protein n=1 Tax=Streptomyces sp. NBC_01485 TaxID=2903884 RepID=UPI002E35A377|nr:tetratricopeptide repeat protein [Streptomyces sp. NBC_01485]
MSPRTNDGEPEQPEHPAPASDQSAPAPDAGRDPEDASAVGDPIVSDGAGAGKAEAKPGATTAGDTTAEDATTGDDLPESAATEAAEAAEAVTATGPSTPVVDARVDAGADSDPGAAVADGADTAAGIHAETSAETSAGPDDRVAAVRRVGAAGRRWRGVQLGACAAMLAVALTAGAIALGAARDGQNVPVATAAAVSPGLLASGNLDSSITALQAHLRVQPKDFGGWATLGLAYVEQARTKGDPSRYPQAEQALKRSLALRPDNDQALAGRAALAAARHDFANALTFADQALKLNPYSERALCSRIDALVELGRYADADQAVRTADERRPGVPVFTRYAYVHELRGDVTTARRVLDRALAASTSPGDIAYVASQLGQLAWNQGDYPSALTHYARALAADENYLPALEGRARAQAAIGQQAEAIKGLELIVARYPLPGPLVELGELYDARGAEGDAAKAQDQYVLVDAWTAIARANGVNADLDTALAAADHGDKATALRAARDDWSRRHTVHTADALAWALHVNGKDAEALPYARQATATGYHNAAFLYHRGVIEKATGHAADARTHLSAALKLNPGFATLGAREARTALKTLEASK